MTEKQEGLPPAPVLLELFQQADNGVRRVAATLGLLISISDSDLGPEWSEALALLQEELQRTRAVQQEIKGAVLPTPSRPA